MKQSINEYQFRQAFHDMGRGDQFSYDGLTALYEYLTGLEADHGEELELDVIALCCDFAESTLAEVMQDYGQDFEDVDEALDYLEENTVYIDVKDAWNLDEYIVIYQQF